MPHMVPQITNETFVSVATQYGVTYIPYSLFAGTGIGTPSFDKGHFLDYLDVSSSDMIYEYHILHDAWGARLSAPGYTDCTEWEAFDNERDAREYIEQNFEVCSYCGEDFYLDDTEIPTTNEEPECHKCGKKYLT